MGRLLVVNLGHEAGARHVDEHVPSDLLRQLQLLQHLQRLLLGQVEALSHHARVEALAVRGSLSVNGVSFFIMVAD